MDILGFKQPFSVMGNSLFDQSVQNRFVYMFHGDEIGYVSKEGFILHNFKTVVDSNASAETLSRLKQELFAVDSAESGLLERNKWAK